MQILQVPEAKNILEAYEDGFITVRELREELEWYWDREIHNKTDRPIVVRTGDPMTEISNEEG
jgi:hypothetical protein